MSALAEREKKLAIFDREEGRKRKEKEGEVVMVAKSVSKHCFNIETGMILKAS